MGKKTEDQDKAAMIEKIKDLENKLAKEREGNRQFRKIFISKVNHEIRTPLNSILGFANLLGNEQLDSIRRRLYIKYLNSSIESLLFRIGNLLDYAVLSPGQMELIGEDNLSVNQLFEELFEAFLIEKQFQEKHQVTLSLSRKKGAENIVATFDRKRLKKIFTILLRSALHGTRKGSVEFGYEPLDGHRLRFFVSDSADQYRTEYIRKVFEKERQEGMSGMDEDLDLSLVRDLVSLMKGKIEIMPKPGGIGNVISFSLPLPYRILTPDYPVPENKINRQKYMDQQGLG